MELKVGVLGFTIFIFIMFINAGHRLNIRLFEEVFVCLRLTNVEPFLFCSGRVFCWRPAEFLQILQTILRKSVKSTDLVYSSHR